MISINKKSLIKIIHPHYNYEDAPSYRLLLSTLQLKNHILPLFQFADLLASMGMSLRPDFSTQYPNLDLVDTHR